MKPGPDLPSELDCDEVVYRFSRDFSSATAAPDPTSTKSSYLRLPLYDSHQHDERQQMIELTDLQYTRIFPSGIGGSVYGMGRCCRILSTSKGKLGGRVFVKLDNKGLTCLGFLRLAEISIPISTRP
jgi:hypothetical protein